MHFLWGISVIKRVVVAGCRDYSNYSEAKEFIDFCISRINKENTLIFVSGGCTGADLLGERYAKENGFKYERYSAEWTIHGKAAGPIRNEKMAQISDYIICFWDGKSKGTKNMTDCAQLYNKPIKIKIIHLDD